MKIRARIAGKRLLEAALAVAALSAGPSLFWAQIPPVPTSEVQQPTGPPVTVSGIVLNAATGRPLPRALVKVDGTQVVGVLTDGDGRFEIPGVSSGEWAFDVSKPGFRSAASGDDQYTPAFRQVKVASGMPELTFSLTPNGAIYGHLTLSSGSPALGIGLTLLRRTINDGRAEWEAPDIHQSTPDGNFRYSGLRDGAYLLMTEPEFDNEESKEPACNADSPAVMPGYAAQFSNGTRDIASAAPILLAKGQNVEIDLALQETNYHLVKVHLLRAPSGAGWAFSHMLLDQNGQEMPYPFHEEKDHSLCAYLPDGLYELAVQVSNDKGALAESDEPVATAPKASTKNFTGVLDFSVDGAAATTLGISLAQVAPTSVHLNFEPGLPTTAKSASRGDEEPNPSVAPLDLSATRVNNSGQQPGAALSADQVSGTAYELEPATPGSYWIHASLNTDGLCLGAVTAAGQDMALVPWVVGPSGTGAPIDVVLRTDCAKLTVQLSAALPEEAVGQGATFYVYAVPLFGTVGGVPRQQIQQFGERSATFEDMTPGTYRVFALSAPRSIEFHNPVALERLGSGQQVTLEPGGSANLVLERISK